VARIERVYRVRAVYRNGETKQRRVLTPEAASERAAIWRQGRPQILSANYAADYEASGEEPPRDVPVVTITPSYPIRYPSAAGDQAQLGLPDTMMKYAEWERELRRMAAALGVRPEAVRGIEMEPERVLVSYSTDDKREPKVWTVELYDAADVTVPEAE
jgi:hypothetical protein